MQLMTFIGAITRLAASHAVVDLERVECSSVETTFFASGVPDSHGCVIEE